MNDSSNDSDDPDDDFVEVVTVDRVARKDEAEDEAEEEPAAKRKRTTEVSRGDLQWAQLCSDIGTSDCLKLKETFGIYKCTIQKTFEYPKGHMRR